MLAMRARGQKILICPLARASRIPYNLIMMIQTPIFIERIAFSIINRTPIFFFESRIAMIPYFIAKFLDRRPGNIFAELRRAIMENSDHLD